MSSRGYRLSNIRYLMITVQSTSKEIPSHTQRNMKREILYGKKTISRSSRFDTLQPTVLTVRVHARTISEALRSEAALSSAYLMLSTLLFTSHSTMVQTCSSLTTAVY